MRKTSWHLAVAVALAFAAPPAFSSDRFVGYTATENRANITLLLANHNVSVASWAAKPANFGIHELKTRVTLSEAKNFGYASWTATGKAKNRIGGHEAKWHAMKVAADKAAQRAWSHRFHTTLQPAAQT